MFKRNLIRLLFSFIFTALLMLGGCSNGGDDSSNTSTSDTSASDTNTVSIFGVVVTPNLGKVTGSTVTAIDLVTNLPVGSSSTQNANGSYNVPTSNTTNPILIRVSGGTFFDEYTGLQQPLPTAGITACLPNTNTTQVAVTPITEIATQAALAAFKSQSNTSASFLASIVSQANANVGSALLGGADPTTTIPVDISQAIPANATAAEKNYTALLAGLATVAANGNIDLYTAATNLTQALFDVYGSPVSTTNNTLPIEISQLQTAVTNYTPPANIASANVPAPDPSATIGLVNTAVATLSSYYYMEVFMDPYTTGTGQTSEGILEIGIENPNITTGISNWSAIAGFINGVQEPSGNAGTSAVSMSPYGQLLWVSTTNPNNTPITFEFSNDGEFAVGDNIGDSGAQAVRLNILVKRPTVAPTLASVAGTYHIALMGHDSSLAPSVAAGYIESGTITLDGAGNLTYKAINTDISSGTLIKTPINSTNSYTVDTYGVVLNTAGNGHMLFSANGEYALYELHAANTQEWGIAIKDHTVTHRFQDMNTSLLYDTHAQGLALSTDFSKAVNVVSTTQDASGKIIMTKRRAFAPAQLSPNIFCGTATTASCESVLPSGGFTPVLVPLAPNTTQAAVNGHFGFADPYSAMPTTPILTGYLSQNGNVFWLDDGEAAALLIGVGR